ncbi:HNRNPH1 [Cordylochernes scorpioides]|uniref:HNRNPH1 n=1 Tax=Cordylochernes scorpioides TaxID=51811 RepID=A0ABY6KRL6_9ARAC|nr:HNRNPH1 [Cordylochernes scorpioides]
MAPRFLQKSNPTSECNRLPEMDDGNVLKVRGLPWSATKDDILKFFQDIKVVGGLSGIHMVTSQTGRPSGEAFVEVETVDDKAKGAHRSEMELTLRRSRDNELESQNSNCVKLRGLPFDCSKEEIVQFFAGLEIVPNGVTLTANDVGKQTGDAYVEFKTSTSAEMALQKHREKIGHRYIEVFRCTPDEVRHAQFPPYEMRPLRGPMRGPAPYDMAPRGPMGRERGDSKAHVGTTSMATQWDVFSQPLLSTPANYPPPSSKSHSIHMRGLPFRANKTDIADFFKPVSIMDIRLIFDKTGKPSGEAEVLFYTHEDAVEGMKKDKEYMQTRYIELFLSSSPASYPGGYGGGNQVTSAAPRVGGWEGDGLATAAATSREDGTWEEGAPIIQRDEHITS